MVKSSKPYAPGNYDEYNKKTFSEKVVSDVVCIYGDCIDKAGSVNMQKYALKLWVEELVLKHDKNVVIDVITYLNPGSVIIINMRYHGG